MEYSVLGLAHFLELIGVPIEGPEAGLVVDRVDGARIHSFVKGLPQTNPVLDLYSVRCVTVVGELATWYEGSHRRHGVELERLAGHKTHFFWRPIILSQGGGSAGLREQVERLSICVFPAHCPTVGLYIKSCLVKFGLFPLDLTLHRLIHFFAHLRAQMRAKGTPCLISYFAAYGKTEPVQEKIRLCLCEV